MKAIRLSLIFPCYNEEESVEPVLDEVLSIIADHPQTEVIVVDDGSSDQTLSRLEKYQTQIRIIRHEKNLGYGAALKTGLFYSTGECISFMDFDGTCDPNEALLMTKALHDNQADMVMGVRLHGDSHIPLTRWIGNQLYRGALKALFPLSKDLPKDVCTGFRTLKRDAALELFDGLPDDLSFSPALTAKAVKRKFKLIDHQISYAKRFGTSKISILKDGFKFGGAMVSERFR
jgi:glycosyltransferase involved in cell wall biosynthesis